MSIEDLEAPKLKKPNKAPAAEAAEAVEINPSPEVMRRYIETYNDQLSASYSIVAEEQSYIAGLLRTHSDSSVRMLPTKYAIYRAGAHATMPGGNPEAKSVEDFAREIAGMETIRIYLASHEEDEVARCHADRMYEPLRQMAILAQLDKATYRVPPIRRHRIRVQPDIMI